MKGPTKTVNTIAASIAAAMSEPHRPVGERRPQRNARAARINPMTTNMPSDTRSWCSSGGVSGSPVAASQTRAVRSKLAVTMRVPSGLNAARIT